MKRIAVKGRIDQGVVTYGEEIAVKGRIDQGVDTYGEEIAVKGRIDQGVVTYGEEIESCRLHEHEVHKYRKIFESFCLFTK